MYQQDLKDNNWLDIYTRAVVVEFTFYNANVNLFEHIIVLFELLSTGKIIRIVKNLKSNLQGFSLVWVFPLT